MVTQYCTNFWFHFHCRNSREDIWASRSPPLIIMLCFPLVCSINLDMSSSTSFPLLIYLWTEPFHVIIPILSSISADRSYECHNILFSLCSYILCKIYTSFSHFSLILIMFSPEMFWFQDQIFCNHVSLNPTKIPTVYTSYHFINVSFLNMVCFSFWKKTEGKLWQTPWIKKGGLLIIARK